MSGNPNSWREIREQNPQYVGLDQPPGYPEPAPVPASRRRGAGFPPEPGSPHKAACTFFLRHVADDAARLVHGSVAPLGERRPAAWVELPEGLAWDGATRRFYPLAAWQDTVAPEVDHRYTRAEAARLLHRSGHGGPWEDDPG